MTATSASGDIIDTIPNADGLEFAADNISIVYTVPDATGRPHQVRLDMLLVQTMTAQSWLA